MGRKFWITSAIAGVVLAFGAPTATAHETSYDTQIEFDESTSNAGFFTFTGRLESSKDQCLPKRTIKFFAVEDQGTINLNDDVRTLLDKDSTSANGAFYLEGDSPAGTDYWVVRLEKKNIGPSGHKHICEADTSAFADG